MRHERHLLESQPLAELIKILHQRVVGDLRGRRCWGSQRPPLVIQHESILICQGLDDWHEVAVLRAPTAMQRDDGISRLRFDTILGDVVRHLGAVCIGGVHVPLVDRHSTIQREGSRLDGFRVRWRIGRRDLCFRLGRRLGGVLCLGG